MINDNERVQIFNPQTGEYRDATFKEVTPEDVFVKTGYGGAFWRYTHTKYVNYPPATIGQASFFTMDMNSNVSNISADKEITISGGVYQHTERCERVYPDGKGGYTTEAK